MTEKNSLHLKTGSFTLDLEGDEAFIRTAYRSVRDEVLARLQQASTPGRRPSQLTDVMPALQENPTAVQRNPNGLSAEADLESQQYAWVHRCNDLYCKVGVVQRKELSKTPMSSYLNPWGIARIFIDTENHDYLSNLVPPSKTLWSELTGMGRNTLRKP
ncbi:MAG: hypothetical protein KC561_18140 [Myxococcales bacterium]|nr:hypothetical protein [Myxococcales bacterium]